MINDKANTVIEEGLDHFLVDIIKIGLDWIKNINER